MPPRRNEGNHLHPSSSACVLIVAYLIPAIAISHASQVSGFLNSFGAKVVSGDHNLSVEAIDQIHRDLGFLNTLPPLCQDTNPVDMFVATRLMRDCRIASRHYPLLHGQERPRRQVERILGITLYRHSLHDSTRHCDICTGEFDSDSPRKGLH